MRGKVHVTGIWTEEMKQKFFELTPIIGKNVPEMFKHFPQVELKQVRNFFMNHIKKLQPLIDKFNKEQLDKVEILRKRDIKKIEKENTSLSSSIEEE
jgi:hypothetical protein